MINDHNKRKMPKRASAIVVAPPKHLYALPTFNYLEIYPTFCSDTLIHFRVDIRSTEWRVDRKKNDN